MDDSRDTRHFGFGPRTRGWRQDRIFELVIALCAEVGAIVNQPGSTSRLPLSVLVVPDSEVRVLGIEGLSQGEKQRLLDNLLNTYEQVTGCRPC
jgi:hypothetical protein